MDITSKRKIEQQSSCTGQIHELQLKGGFLQRPNRSPTAATLVKRGKELKTINDATIEIHVNGGKIAMGKVLAGVYNEALLKRARHFNVVKSEQESQPEFCTRLTITMKV